MAGREPPGRRAAIWRRLPGSSRGANSVTGRWSGCRWYRAARPQTDSERSAGLASPYSMSASRPAAPPPRGDMQQELVERARRGDHDAFAALAAAAIFRLDAAARLILRDPDQAKDAVQEALSGRGETCPRCGTRRASTPGST